MDEKKQGIFKPESEDSTTVGLPFQVLLFNDDWHTFDEVIAQILKAIKCSFEEARS